MNKVPFFLIYLESKVDVSFSAKNDHRKFGTFQNIGFIWQYFLWNISR